MFTNIDDSFKCPLHHKKEPQQRNLLRMRRYNGRCGAQVETHRHHQVTVGVQLVHQKPSDRSPNEEADTAARHCPGNLLIVQVGPELQVLLSGAGNLQVKTL